MTQPPGERPSSVVDDDSWKTPELREAEAAADETMVRSEEVLEKADAMRIEPPQNTVTPENLAAIQAAAEARDATPEMRVLKEKVEKGQLKWEDVLSGKAYNDPDVRNAMASRLAEMRTIYQEFEAGHTLEDVLEARGLNRTDDDRPAQPPSGGPASPAADDDDYFEGGTSVFDDDK